MKKIAQIIPALGYGGAERVVVDLVNNSTKDYHHDIITFFDLPGVGEMVNKKVGVHLVAKKGVVSWHLFSDLKKKLQAINPDLVHTHLFGADFWGRAAARNLGLPVVTTRHGQNTDFGFVKKFLNFTTRAWSDYYVAVSEDERARLLAKHCPRPVVVVKNGIALERFIDLPRPSVGGPIRFLMLGRLEYVKGQDIVLRALAMLKNVDWRLQIAGSGSQENSLKQLANSLNILDRVEFFPARAAIENFYATNDVVLVPSRSEGLGITAMEAMASGCLTVVSGSGGLPELVSDGRTGLVVVGNDCADWIRTLDWIIKNQTVATSLAAAGRGFAKQNFGVDKMVSGYEQVYNKILKNN